MDAPRNGSGTVPIYAPNTAVQNVARHNVYLAYSVFLGSLSGDDQSKIMFVRSTDCGTTWQSPIKISESHHINQGTTIAVSPKDGTIYVAWRQFSSQSEPSAIMICRSNDFGATFTKAVPVAGNINAFDQYSAGNRFRSYAFPTLAVDRDGIVYVAWSERVTPEGDARIVISTSTNGSSWSSPAPIDNYGGRGHQIMPALAYGAGRLTMTWYDTRNSEGGYGGDISDPGPSGKRHTIDVWAAQAAPSLSPTFADFTQVSKYLYWVQTDAGGKVPDNPAVIRKENNYPNVPLFAGGATPFIGDYIDIAPAPRFLFDVNLETQAGTWRFNTLDSDPATSYIGWADNRDVRPPSDSDWTRYNPPTVASSTTPCTDPTRTGMRNQNIYSSRITQGLMIGSPVNTKPLLSYRRSFLVFVKNLEEGSKNVRLTIESPSDPGFKASFWEFGPPPPEKCEYPLLSCGDRQVEVNVGAYSSITLTVFVEPYPANPYATFRVKVEETDGQRNFVDYVVLNPDPENTRIAPVLAEYHTPTLLLESPAAVNLTDPTMLSESIVYSPDLQYILENANPDIVTPTLRSPTLRSGNIVNPTLRSSAVGDIPDGNVTDLQWRITNNNDTETAYSFVPIGDPPSLPAGGAYQLLVYRVSTTPASDQCDLVEEEHHELISKVESPTLRSPTLRSPTLRSPTLRSDTFSLAPGETAVCTLRLIVPGSSSGSGQTVQSASTVTAAGSSAGFNSNYYAKTVAAAAVPQAANPDGQIAFASSLYIVEKELPVAWVNDAYPPVGLEAFGGTPSSIDDKGTPNDPSDDIWNYSGKWTPQALSYPSGEPAGLSLDADGKISGTPMYYTGLSYPQVLSFIAEVTDESSPAPQTAQREFRITVDRTLHKITPRAGTGGSIIPSNPVEVPNGADATFEVKADTCFHIVDVIVDKDASGAIDLGPVATYTFTNVRADHTIDAAFAINTYTITPTGDPPAWGLINPSAPVAVFCGGEQKFTMFPNEGYLLKDVIVDGVSQGPVKEYTFRGVVANHSITAKFQPLESWVKRYNNSPLNGADEAKAVAVHNPTGNIFVTGYSTGSTTGADYFTISYKGDGTQNWAARYDGPSHLGDYATAVAVDAAGNAYVAGYGYRGNVVKHADYATLRYGTSGKADWTAQYDDQRNGMDQISAMAVDKSGFVYVTGRSEDSTTKDTPLHYDYYTIKYDPNTGKVLWAARYNSSQVVNAADEAAGIAVDAAGNVYVTGRSQGTTGFDYATVKYDSAGNQVWVRRYDNAGLVDEATGIAVDTAGNISVTGRSQGTTGFDYATVKYDSAGNQVWVRRYDNAGLVDEATGIAVDTAGNVHVTGRSQGTTTGFDYATVKYDPAGNQVWVSRYDNAGLVDEATGIAVDAAGNVYVTGRSQGPTTDFDFLTIKYDGSGVPVWRARYNNQNVNGADEPAALAVDSAGNVYVTGRSQGGATNLDYVTIKYKQ